MKEKRERKLSLEGEIRNILAGLQRVQASVARLSRQKPQDGSRDTTHRGADALAQIAAYLSMAPTLETDELLHNLLRCTTNVVRAEGAGLATLDAQHRRLVIRAAVGPGSKRAIGRSIPVKGSRQGLALLTGEIQSSTPIYSELERHVGTRFRNVMVAPLVVAGEPVGTLSVVNKIAGNHFDHRDMEEFRLFAEIAAAIMRQRCREELFRRGLEERKAEFPLKLDAEDAELLDLFDLITQARKRNPASLSLLRSLAKSLCD